MAQTIKDVVAITDDPSTTAKAQSNPDGWNALLENLGLNGFAKTALDHNRFTSLFVFAALVLLVLAKTMQPTTKDPFYPEQWATEATIRSEHDQLVSALNNKIDAIKRDLAAKEVQEQVAQQQIQKENQQLAAIISTIGAAAAPFAGPFAPVVLGAVGLAVTGLTFDAARKGGQATQASNTANTQAKAISSSNANPSGQDDVVTSTDKLVQALVAALSKKSGK